MRNEKKQRDGRLQEINDTQPVFMLLQAGTSTFEVVDEELKRKRRAEGVQCEREYSS